MLGRVQRDVLASGKSRLLRSKAGCLDLLFAAQNLHSEPTIKLKWLARSIFSEFSEPRELI